MLDGSNPRAGSRLVWKNAWFGVVLGLMIAAPWPLWAQVPYLVEDLTTESLGTYESAPEPLTFFDGRCYFTAYDVIHGRELWVTDGTESGTHLVADIWPGWGSSQPRRATVFQDRLVFVALDPGFGFEIFVSDGTESGTQMLMDNDGNYNNDLYYSIGTVYVGLGTNLFFQAGSRIWKTDLTPGGSAQVYEGDLLGANSSKIFISQYVTDHYALMAGSGSVGDLELLLDATVGDFAMLSEHLLFESEDLLYTSDGTVDGTTVIADVFPDGTPRIKGLVSNDTHLYFVATDELHGREVWVSDGTPAGTHVLADLTPGVGSSFSYNSGTPMLPLGTRMAFLMNQQLWITAGLEASTVLIDTPGDVGSDLIRMGDEVWFTVSVGEAVEIWKTDGTPEGT